jgi:peptidoglycan/LPS O-acetylase OafA/YrhL
MPRVCFTLTLGVLFLVSVLLGPPGGESTLLWWQKALYAVAGAAIALIVLRLLPEPSLERSATEQDQPPK